MTFSEARTRRSAASEMPGRIHKDQRKHWSYFPFWPPEKRTQPQRRGQNSLPVPLPAAPLMPQGSLWASLCCCSSPQPSTHPEDQAQLCRTPFQAAAWIQWDPSASSVQGTGRSTSPPSQSFFPGFITKYKKLLSSNYSQYPHHIQTTLHFLCLSFPIHSIA